MEQSEKQPIAPEILALIKEQMIEVVTNASPEQYEQFITQPDTDTLNLNFTYNFEFSKEILENIAAFKAIEN